MKDIEVQPSRVIDLVCQTTSNFESSGQDFKFSAMAMADLLKFLALISISVIKAELYAKFGYENEMSAWEL